MHKQLTFRLLQSAASDDKIISKYVAQSIGKPVDAITGFYITKRSIDARSRIVWINITIQAFIDEPYHVRPVVNFNFKDVKNAPYHIVIVGAGPAGLFAALKCIEAGIKPIILERGKDVRARRRDLAILNKEGEINSESNYCFGEGGAGTYSDGKLYTRSTKRGNIDRVLQMLVQFGADEKILYDAHPHIGTNKLPQIITAIRQHLIDCGGEVRFQQKVTDLKIVSGELKAVITADGNLVEAAAFILATGHSARDIFQLLSDKKILIEAKPFALGIRVEHPQELIDSCQYHLEKAGHERPSFLPPASYSLVQQVNGRGVFSFCMCPGGIIAPAATNPAELVVNGWSPSKRNNPFANSGMVVQVEMADAGEIMKQEQWQLADVDEGRKMNNDALSLMHFQQMVEQKAFTAGGGKFVAPAQRMIDFVDRKVSSYIPPNSYLPGLHAADLTTVLPPFIYEALSAGFKAFGKKMRGRKGNPGYYTNEAVIVATESRTSSPVRIPRNGETLEHPQIKNLYPCGEGGGYAGGIVSAAMDGERVAVTAMERLKA
ncbi:FAD-binding protein [soil metagenome]